MGKGRGKFEILHNDKDIIVVNKPAGLLTVPIRSSRTPSLLSLLNEFLAHQRSSAHVVHRIDRYTSGITVFAKHPKARHKLIEQFLGHSPVRTYLAVVMGSLPHDEGELIHYMRQSETGFRQLTKDRKFPGSAKARLTYRVIERLRRVTVVEAWLDTGLKNQIRAQFAAIGNPLVGERQYAESNRDLMGLDRQALHAWKLAFKHPGSNKVVEFSAPLPSDLKKLLRGAGSKIYNERQG
jgi:23S rRNA pseudouridine1911/1915/1917 synthase